MNRLFDLLRNCGWFRKRILRQRNDRGFASQVPAEALTQRVLLSADALGSVFAGQAWFATGPAITFDSSRPMTHTSMIHVGSEIWAYSTDNTPDGSQFYVRLFTSADGNSWHDRGIVLNPAPGTYYDRMCSFPGVIKVGATFYMVFEAQQSGSYADIGLATSSDGLNWTCTAQPILRATGSGFERINIGTPSLYYQNGQFTLFYHAYDGNVCRVMAATGPDLFHLTRANNGNPVIDVSYNNSFDSGTIGKRSQVFFEGGYYYMAVEVSSTQVPGAGYAGSDWTTIIVRSQSLTTGWTKLPGTVLPQTVSGMGFDGPEMVDINGELRIYARNKTGYTRNYWVLQEVAPPSLSAISTLGPASEQTPYSISYNSLLGASNATSANGNPAEFRIMSAQNGTLTITHNGATVAVVAGTTLLGPGDTLTWTGNPGATGNNVDACTVAAYDNVVNSATQVQVKLNVVPLGASFDLSGIWTVNNASGNAVGLGSMTQSGASLAMTDAVGRSLAGNYATFNQLVVPNFSGPGTAAATGTVDTNSADDGQIMWRDGSGNLLAVWLRNLLAGTYSVITHGSNTPTLGSITQNGRTLSLTGSSTAAATVTNASQILVSGADTATYGDGTITFTTGAFAGQVWTKLDLPANFTNQTGAATHVIPNGTAVTFVDKFGGTSPGIWINPTQLQATGWNETVTVALGKLLWQDGSTWSENLTINGSHGVTGLTTITAAPSQVYVFDFVNGSGKPVHLIQTGTNNVVFIDGAGHMSLGTFISPTQAMTPYYMNDFATISNDLSTITWTDGMVWTRTARTAAVTLTDYTNSHGVAVHLIQNGTSQVTFVDGLGRVSLGTMQSPTTALADLYPGDLATISANNVSWQDGVVWTQTNSTPPTITFTDANGAVSHVGLSSLTTLVGLDGPLSGLTATRSNDQIVWSSGAIWANFDFNSLNALFEMAIR